MGTAFRKLIVVACACALAVLGIVVASAGPAAAAPLSLALQQGYAFSILGHSCGGIQEKPYATGFASGTGYPTGDVYLSTRCGGSGHAGGGTTLYQAWANVTWDFTGAVVSYAQISTTPTVNPSLVVYDSHGNELYNQAVAGVVDGSQVYTQAYLVLAPGFVPAPRVTAMSPTFGPASGGTSVTLTGTGFSGANPAVDFGTTAAASFTVNSDTSITAVSPQSPQQAAGTFDVTVSNAGGTSATSAIDQFTFYAMPSVTSINPNTGPVNGGTGVALIGTHFLGATAVTFGDTQAGFYVNSDASITAFAPAEGNPDTVSITVTTPGGTSTPTPADVYTYAAVATGTPGAPTSVTAVAGDGSATVSFVTPSSDGGSPISSYTVLATDTSNPANGGQSVTGSASPIAVTSLSNGDTYTFTVTAANVNGPGTSSAPSNPVVPQSAAAPPTFHIVTASLPDAPLGTSYRVHLQATGGPAPYKWKALDGLPPGFRLHTNGILVGKPTVKRTPAGLYAVTVEVSTKATKTSPSQTATQVLMLSVT
jgi:hypothetical protein